MSYETYWSLGKTFYDKNDVIIAEVYPKIDYGLSPNELDELHNNKWVIKIMSGDRFYINELGKMESIDIYDFEHSIKFPSNKKYRNGRQDKISWYVMELLPYKLENSCFSIKKNISEFVNEIINFLEWLHVEKNRVHGDLKSDNIVGNIFTNKYKIIDYENITKISDIICKNDLPNGYYYYSNGCEVDKPYYSYRCDLQVIGYILWNITRNEFNSFELFLWQKKGLRRYMKEIEYDDFEHLEELKKIDENEQVKPDYIKQYFEIISEVDWYETNPKKETYQRLRDVFKDVQLEVINPL